MEESLAEVEDHILVAEAVRSLVEGVERTPGLVEEENLAVVLEHSLGKGEGLLLVVQEGHLLHK